MLNRLYIVIGVLAILGLLGAFVVPHFIDWGGYRDRMEAIASSAIGADVDIAGDIQFTLLPQPRMTFTNVIVGPPEAPVAMIGGVEAEFSLFDFLRDRYRVTRLVLQQPRLELRIGVDGQLEKSLTLPKESDVANVSVENAEIESGMVRLTDARRGDGVYDLTQLNGTLELGALRGPFAFNGHGIYGGGLYTMRVSTSALAADETAHLSAFLRPASQNTSLSLEGTINFGDTPGFEGDVAYRKAPESAGLADNVVGDLVVTGQAKLDAERLLLTSYIIVPDENRSGTRLTGAAEVDFGEKPTFNAVISGGALALPPRDATAEEAVTPYELVRLLGELTLPPVPPLSGTVGVDITELDIRAVTLRNIRLDAATAADGWAVRDFTAQLPGNTALKMFGDVTVGKGKPEFNGHLSLSTTRGEALAALWRKPAAGNTLSNVPASLEADVTLGGDLLSLDNGTFTLDGVPSQMSAQVGLGDARHLQVSAALGAMSPIQSTALASLLPDALGDPAFGLTFPRGEIALSAASANLFGLSAENLTLAGGWEGGVFELDKAAGTIGGADVSLALTVFGTLAKPEMFGDATLKIADASAPALALAFDRLGVPAAAADALRRFVPADLSLRLDQPGGDGSQMLAITGTAAAADLNLGAILGSGLVNAIGGTVSAKLTLNGQNGDALTAQLGLGDVGIFPKTAPMGVEASLDGSLADGFKTVLTLAGGNDTLSFDGSMASADEGRWTGTGALTASLSDPTPLGEWLGLTGFHLPTLNGKASLAFAGRDNVSLNDIDLKSGESAVTGDLLLRTTSGTGRVSGELKVGAVDLNGLLGGLAGPASLIAGDSVWPIGPLSAGDAPRAVTGRVHITSPGIFAGENEQPLVADASFDLDWDETKAQVRALEGTMAGGHLAADFAICCAGALPDKQVTGRATLTDADLDKLLPPRLAAVLGGTLDFVAQVEGTGDSFASVAAGLTGQGTYGISGLTIARFDPKTFATIAGISDLLNIEPAALTPKVAAALEQGPFAVPQAAGSFTIAGGTLRSPNLALEGEVARLFGGASVNLPDLSLSGSYTLTPVGAVDAAGIINDATSRITSVLGGTVLEPTQTLDLGTMVDGIKVRAYEIELAGLERQRAEDEARVAVANADRQRVAAEQQAYNDALGMLKAAADLEKARTTATGESVRIAGAVADTRAAIEAAAADAAIPAPVPTPVAPLDTPSTVFLAPLNLTPTESPNQF